MNNLDVEGSQNQPKELLEENIEGLDIVATEAAIRANPAMEAVGALDGVQKLGSFHSGMRLFTGQPAIPGP